MRGFLVTGVKQFLEPYERASPEQVFQELEVLLDRDDAQLARIYELRARYETWLAAASSAAVEGHLDESRRLDSMLDRKEKMDEVRKSIQVRVAERAPHAPKRAPDWWLTATRRRDWSCFGLIGLRRTGPGLRHAKQHARRHGHLRRGPAQRARASWPAEGEGWLREGQIQISDVDRGEHSIDELAARFLGAVVPLVGAEAGVLYVSESDGLRCRAMLGIKPKLDTDGLLANGDGSGRPGQPRAASYWCSTTFRPTTSRSPLARERATRASLVLVPAVSDGVTHAVLELGFFRPLDERTRELLARLGETARHGRPLGAAPSAHARALSKVPAAGRGAPRAAGRAAGRQRGAAGAELARCWKPRRSSKSASRSCRAPT